MDNEPKAPPVPEMEEGEEAILPPEIVHYDPALWREWPADDPRRHDDPDPLTTDRRRRKPTNPRVRPG